MNTISHLTGKEKVIRKTLAEHIVRFPLSEHVPAGYITTTEWTEEARSQVREHMSDDMVRKLSSGLVGSSVIVPAYLSGHPMHMRRRVQAPRMSRHVSVVADISISGALSEEDYTKRGYAIYGLVEALQAEGLGVSLKLTVDTGDTKTCIQVIDCGQGPFSSDVLQKTLCSHSFGERSLHGCFFGCGGSFSALFTAHGRRRGDSVAKAHAYANDLRRIGVMSERDVYAPESMSVLDPYRWIAVSLQSVFGKEEEVAA